MEEEVQVLQEWEEEEERGEKRCELQKAKQGTLGEEDDMI